MMSLKPLTYSHFTTAKGMPMKRSQILTGERARKWERTIKRERKVIAAYYRLIRVHEDYGYPQARLAHRYGQVTTASDARWRIGQLTPSKHPAPAYC